MSEAAWCQCHLVWQVVARRPSLSPLSYMSGGGVYERRTHALTHAQDDLDELKEWLLVLNPSKYKSVFLSNLELLSILRNKYTALKLAKCVYK